MDCKSVVEVFGGVSIVDFCVAEAEARREKEDNTFKKARQLNKLLDRIYGLEKF